MTKLTEKQEARVRAIVTAKENVDAAIAVLEAEHEQRLHALKAPVHRAVDAALREKVPFNTIMKDGLGMTYPQKAKQWLAPPDIREHTPVVEAGNKIAEAAKELPAKVVRDDSTGIITVHHDGETFEIVTYGPAGEFWSSVPPTTPQAVLDAVKDQYPFWQHMFDDEEV